MDTTTETPIIISRKCPQCGIYLHPYPRHGDLRDPSEGIHSGHCHCFYCVPQKREEK